MEKKFSYSRKEKLKSRKLIARLFAEGKAFSLFPLKAYYLNIKETLDYPIKFGAGAATKNFKKAVDRNHIKRILRDAYRTEKIPLQQYLNEQKKQLLFFILYIDKTLPEKNVIKKTMPMVIEKLIHILNEKAVTNI